jgi:SAM-dependent methyltransferase
MSDPTTRFSNRVENYVRYRPGYPEEIVASLTKECGLRPESVVADIGSGTGLLTGLFLARGNRVFAVEPNPEMRAAGERLLGSHPRFTSVAAPAEATTLPDGSIDFITVGQAFHWFDRERCRGEFRRILRPEGWVALVWNDRRIDATPFLVEYEQLLRTFATDYAKVDHKQIDLAVLREFFKIEPARRVFPNFQRFDLNSLRGRLLSASYVPEAGEPRHEEMLRALQKLFEKHHQEGSVTLEYDTLVFFGRLG